MKTNHLPKCYLKKRDCSLTFLPSKLSYCKIHYTIQRPNGERRTAAAPVRADDPTTERRTATCRGAHLCAAAKMKTKTKSSWGETHGLKKLAERKFLRLRRAAHQFAHDRRQQVYFPGIFIYLFLAVSVTLFCRSCDS